MLALRKTLILPCLLLIVAFFYDNISLREKPSDECFQSTKLIIAEILEKNASELLSPQFTQLYEKSNLELSDLGLLKTKLDELAANNLETKIFNQDEPVFWTETYSDKNFCKTLDKNGFTGKICYAPFDHRGRIDSKHLETLGFHHYFRKDHNFGAQKIKGVSVIMGDRFRTTLSEYLLLLLYFIAFLWIILFSLKTKNYWPLLALGTLRAFAVRFNWFDRYNLNELVDSFTEVINYNSIDLLFDSCLLFSLMFFIADRYIISYPRKLSKVAMMGLSFLHIIIFISHIRLIQLLVRSENTKLSIEDLGQTSIADSILFASMVLIQLGIFHFSYSLFKHYKESTRTKSELYGSYGLSIIIGVVLGYLLKLDLDPLLLALFLFCYILLMDLFVDVKTRTITWIIWWGIFFAIYLSALFFNYDIKKEIKSRQIFLKEIFNNIPSKKIAGIQETGLRDTIGSLVSSLLVLPLPQGIDYDKTDLETYVHNKLGREDISLELYNKEGNSLFDDEDLESFSLKKQLKIDSITYFDEIQNTLWMRYVMSNTNSLYIGIKPKSRDTKPPFEFNYYRDDKSIQVGQELDKTEIALIENSEEEVIYNGSDVYTIYRPSSSRLLVTKKSFLGLIKPIALFSFLFSIIIILIMIIGILNRMFRFLPHEWPLFIQNLESLNSKIQLSLILVILLSFIIIASITSTFLKDYLSEEKKLVTTDKLENVAKDFETRTKLSTTPSETVEVISNFKKNIEEIHNVDLKVFPISIPFSDLDYFTKMWFTKQNEPLAFTKRQTNINPLSFVPIWSQEKLAGVARVEMRSKIQDSKLNVFDFLGSIFNVYVFLFLIASVISIFIAQSITRPLSMLNQKLTQVKLGKRNEEIAWDRDDEIGVLIGNYNTMVSKLGESAEILAKNERDSAWREMAKQVAHEIKNPLTPMKLSIQYLEKAIKQNPDNALPIAKKISNTMLEQIDNLTGIAEAFGNFAELPKTSNEKVELNNIVEVVHNLFRKREDMDIKLSVPIDPIHVYADKSQLVRILNNLVKNAIESVPKEKRGEISVELYTRQDKAIIEVRDNGIGIPTDMKDKIFQPKFTTKDSGSGLGLAIAANMIESMNGRIYFESDPSNFTSFYIELDIIRQAIIADSQERITLD